MGFDGAGAADEDGVALGVEEMALIVNRVIAPASKFATVGALNPQTAASSLGERLVLGEVREAEIYGCLDWLLDQSGLATNAGLRT